jgi:hypothetical protein
LPPKIVMVSALLEAVLSTVTFPADCARKRHGVRRPMTVANFQINLNKLRILFGLF